MFKIKVPKRFTVPVMLLRANDGAYVDGKWVDGIRQERLIHISFQPIQSGDYRLLSEGESPLGVYKAYWNGIFDHGKDGLRSSDQLIYKNTRYKLLSYNIWAQAGFSVALFKEVKP